MRRNKSCLGGQDTAQFPETIGLRGRLELNKESSCYGQKSRKEREGSGMSDGQDHTSTNLAGMGQKAVKGYDRS